MDKQQGTTTDEVIRLWAEASQDGPVENGSLLKEMLSSRLMLIRRTLKLEFNSIICMQFRWSDLLGLAPLKLKVRYPTSSLEDGLQRTLKNNS